MTKKQSLTPAALSALSAGDIDNAIVASTPGGIEAQEAQGQRDLVASERLPKEMLNCTREQLETLGFVFGDDADDIFVNCKLPDGWKYKPTDHSMHSDILDEQGRRRLGVFYKAAFYDRNAHCHLIERFHTGTDYSAQGEHYDPDKPLPVCVFDRGKPVKTVGEAVGYKQQSVLKAEAESWLDENYPDWRDPLAYWQPLPPAPETR